MLQILRSKLDFGIGNIRPNQLSSSEFIYIVIYIIVQTERLFFAQYACPEFCQLG